MCHCAPVFRIHNTASRTRRVGIGLRPGRLSGTFSSGKCSRIRSHCSSRSFNTHRILRHYIDVRNDFEIGSSLIDLYAPVSVTQTPISDPLNGNTIELATVTSGGNPKLKAETGQSRTVGI